MISDCDSETATSPPNFFSQEPHRDIKFWPEDSNFPTLSSNDHHPVTRQHLGLCSLKTVFLLRHLPLHNRTISQRNHLDILRLDSIALASAQYMIDQQPQIRQTIDAGFKINPCRLLQCNRHSDSTSSLPQIVQPCNLVSEKLQLSETIAASSPTPSNLRYPWQARLNSDCNR